MGPVLASFISYFSFFLYLLAHSIMNIMPGSVNLEILRKNKHFFSCVLTKRGVPSTPLWSGYWPQKETDYSNVV